MVSKDHVLEEHYLPGYPNLILEVTDHPSAAFIDFSKQTIWGKKGGIQYKQSLIDQRIIAYPESQFLRLHRNNRTIGSIHFVPKDFENVTLAYVRYFSFSHGLGNKSNSTKNKGNNLIKEGISHWLLHEQVGLKNLKKGAEGIYGYIEKNNFPSLNMSQEFGFEPVSEFQTYIFGRSKPKTKLKTEEHISPPKEVKDYYSRFVSGPVHSSDNGNWFTYSEKGEVIAAIRAVPCTWEIIELPGAVGKVLKSLLPRLIKDFPGFEQFNFLSFEGHYCKQNHEQSLLHLMETSLAQQNALIGLNWLDSKHPLNTYFKHSKKLGCIGNLKKDISAHVVLKNINLSSQKIDLIKQRPFYISGFDLT